MTYQDAKQYAPATQRNREPILSILQQYLPSEGLILEIASGTGEHAIYFAKHLAPRLWLPSDLGEIQLKSIAAWRLQASLPNLLEPIQLDVMHRHWPQQVSQLLPLPNNQSESLAAIVNINMIHIAPWAATVGLMVGSAALLEQGGILYLYGPYQMDGKHTAPSNAAFDELLRSQHPAWGVRHLEKVIALAEQHQLHWRDTIPMPANNFSVIFERER